MIVIAIIGILAAALFPSLSGYLWRARDASRVINVRQIADVVNTYKNTYEVFPNNSSWALDYCVSDIFNWSDGSWKDQKYQDLSINLKIIPQEKAFQRVTSPCTQTWSYLYSRLIDAAGNQYAIIATTMETNSSVTYLTGSDFIDPTKIMQIMWAQQIKNLDIGTVSSPLTPMYHLIIN